MSRKFYQMISRLIAEERRQGSAETIDALDRLAARLADELGKDNPYFDGRQFLIACGALDKPDNGNQGYVGGY